MSPESISPGNNLRRFVTAAEKNRFTRTFLLSDPTLMFVTVSFFFAPSLFWICAFSNSGLRPHDLNIQTCFVYLLGCFQTDMSADIYIQAVYKPEQLPAPPSETGQYRGSCQKDPRNVGSSNGLLHGFCLQGIDGPEDAVDKGHSRLNPAAFLAIQVVNDLCDVGNIHQNGHR